MTPEELEEYFNNVELPDKIQLDACTIIHDLPKFIDCHLSTFSNYSTTPRFKQYYNRLISLKEILTST